MRASRSPAGAPRWVRAGARTLRMLESSNGRDYVVVFAARRKRSTRRLPSRSTARSTPTGSRWTTSPIDIGDAFDRTTPCGRRRLSWPTPTTTRSLAYAVDVATKWSRRDVRNRPRSRFRASTTCSIHVSPRTPGQRAFVRQVVTETAALTTVVNPEPRADIVVPACEVPFGGAHMVHLVSPTLSADRHQSTSRRTCERESDARRNRKRYRRLDLREQPEPRARRSRGTGGTRDDVRTGALPLHAARRLVHLRERL